jgi:hypothetical protein
MDGLSKMGKKVAAARGADLTLLVSGGIFLVATFLPWYRIKFAKSVLPNVGRDIGYSSSAWNSQAFGVIAALLGIGALIVAITVVTGSTTPGPQTAGLLAFGLSAGALLFTFLRLIFRPAGSRTAEVLTRGLLEVDRGYGLFIALLAAIVMTIAGYQKYREHAV